jgi:hypothetical protein
VKNIPSTLKMLLKRVWRKDGDSPPDYTFHSSEMRGELDAKYKNEQHERAMKAPINKPLDEQLREKGLL